MRPTSRSFCCEVSSPVDIIGSFSILTRLLDLNLVNNGIFRSSGESSIVKPPSTSSTSNAAREIAKNREKIDPKVHYHRTTQQFHIKKSEQKFLAEQSNLFTVSALQLFLARTEQSNFVCYLVAPSTPIESFEFVDFH